MRALSSVSDHASNRAMVSQHNTLRKDPCPLRLLMPMLMPLQPVHMLPTAQHTALQNTWG